MNITPFNFNNNEIRVIEKDGESWFVAKDVAELLGYSNSRDAINKHCKAKASVAFHDGSQSRNITIIPERDLYRLIMRSKLPAAEAFEEWIVSEVLPSIRKTGSYQVAQPSQPKESKQLMEANRMFKSNFSVTSLIFSKNQALLSANQATRNATEIDVLENMGVTHLISEKKEVLLTPSDIGKQMGLTARKVNELLLQHKLQTSFRDHRERLYYELTDSAKELAQVVDTGRKHSSGAFVTQIKWYSSVVELLKNKLH